MEMDYLISINSFPKYVFLHIFGFLVCAKSMQKGLKKRKEKT